MRTPYVVPEMLRDAPLGIDWESVGGDSENPLDNLAALMDVCDIATSDCDTNAFQSLRATVDVDEWEGPDEVDTRWTIRTNGISVFFTTHWPVLQIIEGQIAYQSDAFNGNFKTLAANQLRVAQTMLSDGTALASSGADGSNMITMAAGLSGWGGWGGMVAQIAYIDGYPHAGLLPFAVMQGSIAVNDTTITGLSSTAGLAPGVSVSHPALPPGTVIAQNGVLSASSVLIQTPLTNSNGAVGALMDVVGGSFSFGYAAGVTQLNVDDVTGFSVGRNTKPTIFDSAAQETVIVTGATAANPLQLPLVSGTTAQVGPGIVTLQNPTIYPHTGTVPATAVLTTMPASIREACYYFAASEALSRGATATTVPTMSGGMQHMMGLPDVYEKKAVSIIERFARVF